ncbi:MAG TPA: cytochrome c oxidase subunit 3 [Gammaproteobacteria bacterium]|nr:cytochrome c oxidase subunit 3 [Gammaproteobacteria bacterium]
MSTASDQYYVPEGSHWPIIAAGGVFVLFIGFAFWMNGVGAGKIFSVVGTLITVYLFYGWFKSVIHESLSGKYNTQVDSSFRQGMMWFITSEVAFFAVLFGALAYFRIITLPYLGGEGFLANSHLLWPEFDATWPILTPPNPEAYPPTEAMGPMGIPLLNTILLLTSGATITWAHHGLKHNNQKVLVVGLILTIALGATFMGFQAYEYYHAYHALNLTLNSGVYGSTFYILTGFHGLHVTIGTIMLIFIAIRSAQGHFTPEKHFAFEGVAWYWHFVDVVWIGLYIFVYWL